MDEEEAVLPGEAEAGDGKKRSSDAAGGSLLKSRGGPFPESAEALEIAEWCTVLDDLRELGTLFITVTGGEPLAHPGFFAIASEIKRRSFSLEIFTNGSLIDEEKAARIADISPSKVELSLHGATAATHDLTTGKAGSFEAFLRGVDLLTSFGVPVGLKTPITRLNLPEVEQMVELARAKGLPLKLDGTLVPRDDGSAAPIEYRVSREDVDVLMKKLAAAGQVPGLIDRQEEGFNCGLGRITLSVDPEGNVFPCIQWKKEPLGNVRERRIRELWRGSSARLEATSAADSVNRKLCALGPPLAEYAFCPGLAERLCGDATRITPWHERMAGAAFAIRQRTPAG